MVFSDHYKRLSDFHLQWQPSWLQPSSWGSVVGNWVVFTQTRGYRVLGGSSPLGYVGINHGDRKSPKDRVVGPLPNGRFMAYTWG